MADAAATRAALERALAARPSTGIHAAVLPSPRLSPEALFALWPAQTAVLWAPPDGPVCVGLGATAELVAAGADRGAALATQARGSAAAVRVWREPGIADLSVRWIGGMMFAGSGGADDAWAPFPPSLFVLPRWRYEENDGTAALVVAMHAKDDAAPDRLRAELSQILSAVGAPVPEPPARTCGPCTIEHVTPAAWDALIGGHLAALQPGGLEKIVAARRSVVTFAQPLGAGAVAAVLVRLRQAQPGCTRFALRRGDATFFGATPERLIRKNGPVLSTEALAGSCKVPPGEPPGEAAVAAAQKALLASKKDRREHALVADYITEQLAPLCMAVRAAPAPQVRRLRHLLHLHTPIEAELRRGMHVLEVVQALHPTPAVGGLPAEAALARIAAAEPVPRGFYAGPFGWFDADGDGELVVALRSAVARDRRAFVYAGAGIVAGSVAASEYAETALKLRAVLDALGCAGGDAP